jgi:DNA-binding CsgD family transcriptional regulator
MRAATSFNDIDEKARRIVVARSRSILPGDDIDEVWVWANYDDLPFCKGFGPGESGIARMSDVLDRAALDRSPIYRDVMWPDGYRYSVEVVFASPPSVRRAVLLGRADRDFTVRECDLLALLLPHLEDAYRRARLTSLLTPREREVLSLVGEGLANREIARRLDISPGTVRAHLEHAYPKLGVGSRTAAISIVR